MAAGSKQLVTQACDNCSRDFTPSKYLGWHCPYCDYDNKQGCERLSVAGRAGAMAAKQKRLERMKSQTR